MKLSHQVVLLIMLRVHIFFPVGREQSASFCSFLKRSPELNRYLERIIIYVFFYTCIVDDLVVHRRTYELFCTMNRITPKSQCVIILLETLPNDGGNLGGGARRFRPRTVNYGALTVPIVTASTRQCRTEPILVSNGFKSLH